MTDQEREQQDNEAADDAKEDLELTDDDADQVRGGLASKQTDVLHEGFK